MNNLSERLTYLLKVNKMKRADFVRATGISEGTIRGWYNGKCPSAEVAYKVAKYFGVTVEWLLTGEGSPIKNFKHYEYKKITFPVRDCTFTRNGHDLSGVLVGSEIMSGLFFKEDGGYVDEEAEQIDNLMYCYIPHDELLNLSDNEILEYIHKYIDEYIYDSFEE